MNEEQLSEEELRKRALKQVEAEKKRWPRLNDQVLVDLDWYPGKAHPTPTMKGRILGINGDGTLNIRVGQSGAVVPVDFRALVAANGDPYTQYGESGEMVQ